MDFKEEAAVGRDYNQTLHLRSRYLSDRVFRAVVIPLKRLYKTNEREYPFNLVRIFTL